jgi:sugar phosphate isomerase/epimerase
VAGTGEVPWRQFFQVLDEQRFSGYCAIEREAGNQRVQDIQAARKMVESLVG